MTSPPQNIIGMDGHQNGVLIQGTMEMVNDNHNIPIFYLIQPL